MILTHKRVKRATKLEGKNRGCPTIGKGALGLGRMMSLLFIEPCLPMMSRTVPTGGGWAYEIKHDGFRLICRRDGERVRCYSRGGHDWSAQLPAVVEAMRAFPVTSVGACTKRAPPLFRKSKSLENENIVCVRRRPYGPKSFYLAAAIRCTTDGIAPIKKLRGCVRVTGADRTRPRF